ncbi:MAG: FecR domain-containing protein [Tannerellaceae bacterium]|jgi:ferric-dicitrate binding protein FerR (iron transport regulator)|nr:FecR domain-containing protein [Tannerellaceae bacterium]
MRDKEIPWGLIVKRLKGELSDEDELVFEQWRADDEHQAVYEELEMLWYAVLKENLKYETHTDALWRKMEGLIRKGEPKKITFALNTFRRWASLAAVVVLAILLTSAYVTLQWYQAGTVSQVYSSLTGKSKIRLPDGTDVWLNVGSSIEYSTQAWNKTRHVALNGEAFFDVRKKTDSPFLVSSHGFSVKVYGTSFNMRANEENLNVSLLSGSLSVSSGDKTAFIAPGERAVCLKNEREIYVEKSDVELESIWAKESIRFEKKSLRELSKYLSQWYGVEILVSSSIPEEQAYTFTLRNESLEDILHLMTLIHPIQYFFKENNVIIQTNPIAYETHKESKMKL